MPNMDRALSGKPLHFRLGGEHGPDLVDGGLLARSGRSARTLVKDGPLRVTLMALGAGGGLREHHADGPITVHVISGQIQFRAGEEEWTLEEGDLLSLGARVPHSVESAAGGVFVLTVATTPEP